VGGTTDITLKGDAKPERQRRQLSQLLKSGLLTRMTSEHSLVVVTARHRYLYKHFTRCTTNITINTQSIYIYIYIVRILFAEHAVYCTVTVSAVIVRDIRSTAGRWQAISNPL